MRSRPFSVTFWFLKIHSTLRNNIQAFPGQDEATHISASRSLGHRDCYVAELRQGVSNDNFKRKSRASIPSPVMADHKSDPLFPLFWSWQGERTVWFCNRRTESGKLIPLKHEQWVGLLFCPVDPWHRDLVLWKKHPGTRYLALNLTVTCWEFGAQVFPICLLIRNLLFLKESDGRKLLGCKFSYFFLGFSGCCFVLFCLVFFVS